MPKAPMPGALSFPTIRALNHPKGLQQYWQSRLQFRAGSDIWQRREQSFYRYHRDARQTELE
jgi:hypothetical protein